MNRQNRRRKHEPPGRKDAEKKVKIAYAGQINKGGFWYLSLLMRTHVE